MTVRRRTYRDAKGRKQVRWVIDITHRHPDGREERVRKTSPVQTRRGAEQYERQLRAEMAAGGCSEPPGGSNPPLVTVGDVVGLYLERYAVPRLKATTVARIRSYHANHYNPVLGDVLLVEFGVQHWDALVYAARTRGLAASSINNIAITLRAILNRASAWGMIENVPAYKNIRTLPPQTRVLSKEEEHALLNVLQPENWKRAAILALNTGLRLGELLGLDWEDIEWSGARLHVRRTLTALGDLHPPKSGKERTLPLPSAARRVLREQHASDTGQSAHVFGARNSRARCSYATAAMVIRNRRARAGLKGIGWHTLRHTFATRLILRGAPLRVVQALLGHSSVSMTLRYSHLTDSSLRDAIALLEDF